MDLVAFHQNWLGKDSQHTPIQYQVGAKQVELYAAWPQARGISTKERDPELFVAAFILALAQTKPEDDRRVFLITPRSYIPWVKQQMETVARYMIQCRKKSPEGIDIVKAVCKQIYLCDNPFKLVEPPARWVALGFKIGEVMPQWVSEALIEAGP